MGAFSQEGNLSAEAEFSKQTERSQKIENVARFARSFFSSLNSLDFVLLSVGVLWLFPAFKLANLPLRIDFKYFAVLGWDLTFVLGPCAAILLAVIGLPLNATLKPFFLRLRRNKPQIAIVVLLSVILIAFSGFLAGSIETVAVLTIMEFFQRRSLRSGITTVVPPILYLFLVFILEASFNHALAGTRNPQLYDSFFERLDRNFFHANVSAISHWSIVHGPNWLFTVLDLFYGTMFIRLVAKLMILCCLGGQRYGFRFVRAVAVCYAIALTIYALVPAKGPYSICPTHASEFDTSTKSYLIQGALTEKVKMLWAHSEAASESAVSPDDYYISFPSLHVALPLIGIWFLRRWRRFLIFYTSTYLLLLLPSIVLLEWHYLVDIIGGFATAALAIWIAETASRRSDMRESEGLVVHTSINSAPSLCPDAK